MVLEIVFIAISVVVIAAVLVHKHFELAKGAAHPAVADVRGKADVRVETAIAHTEAAVSKVTLRNGVMVANGAVVWTARILLAISSAVSHAFHIIVERASHRQDKLKNGGAASFYMKQIREAKDDTQITNNK
ncbi:MAG: hypothetical protein WC767_00630 [Candidatus Paceibacterota bacterium]|jgi:hypothetical protein